MILRYVYHPVWFYLITILTALIPGAIYFLKPKGTEQLRLILGMLSLCVPCITALVMILISHNNILIEDFYKRLFLFKISPIYLMVILFIMPLIVCLATWISLFFGYTSDQFSITNELSIMKGWNILGIVFPLLLVPIIEEIAWRGYGVDSLRSYFNLFTTSVLFGLLWATWHLPAFFVKGFYQNQLLNLGKIHVINYFISVFVAAFLINWIYYKTGRSIPAIILFHSVANLSMMLFKTEPFTKGVVTILLFVAVTFIIIFDSNFFFREKTLSIKESNNISNLNQHLKCQLNHLQSQYGFSGATVAYVLPDSTVGEVASGFADMETKEPMTIKSRMLAASIGKTFVAATVIALAKEDRLNLDDPLSLYLGKRNWYFRLPNHETITLRHLLTHSTGLPSHVNTASFQQSQDFKGMYDENLFSPESLIEYILDCPPLFEAGKGWAYTDTGYILLGLVIESVVGNTYYDELNRRFLKPLKLDMTTPSNRPRLRGLVAGYTAQDKVYGLPRKILDKSGSLVFNPVVEWTGGGLISTSRDLAIWAKLLYEGHAMPFDYLADLFQSVSVGDEESGVRYGAGVLINQKDPLGEKLGHGGVIPGYSSSMRYYSKYGLAVAFQINTDSNVSDFVSNMEKSLAEIIIRNIIGIN